MNGFKPGIVYTPTGKLAWDYGPGLTLPNERGIRHGNRDAWTVDTMADKEQRERLNAKQKGQATPSVRSKAGKNISQPEGENR